MSEFREKKFSGRHAFGYTEHDDGSYKDKYAHILNPVQFFLQEYVSEDYGYNAV